MKLGEYIIPITVTVVFNYKTVIIQSTFKNADDQDVQNNNFANYFVWV